MALLSIHIPWKHQKTSGCQWHESTFEIKLLLCIHCVKSVQIRSYFWFIFSPNTGKYGTETTPYLDTFYAMNLGTPFIPVVFENFSQMIWNITSPKVYLQPSRTSMMGLLGENSCRLLTVNYFCKNASS